MYPLHSIDFIWPKLEHVTHNLSDHNILGLLSALYGTSGEETAHVSFIAITLRRGLPFTSAFFITSRKFLLENYLRYHINKLPISRNECYFCTAIVLSRTLLLVTFIF